MGRPFRHLIFDLDGTILDTITDIVYAMNTALERVGFPYRYDRDSARYLIGDGADECIRRALKEKGSDPDCFALLKPHYMELYRDHQTEHATPFPKLKEVLIELKNRGYDLCCVTNKPDALAHTVLDLNYGEGFFSCIIGESGAHVRKPDPSSVFDCMRRCGFDPKECIYIGDSHVDVATAHNAKLPAMLCTWGYETDYPGTIPTADYVVNKPEDLLSFFIN